MSASTWLNDETEILLDFIGDLYRHPDECLRNGNIIDFREGIVLLWSKRSDIDPKVKSRMRELLENIEPELFHELGRSEWSLNLTDYPTLEDAENVLERGGVWEIA